MKKLLTLCIIYEHPRILLGMKKRGFGKGRWNGFGGKVEKGETIEEAAKRELTEEVGVMPHSLEKRGIIEFEFKDNPEILEMHIFCVNGFAGTPKESDEMKPQWFDVSEIPFDSMWSDDKYWLPSFLNDKKFKGKFFFDVSENVIDKEFDEVENL